MSKNSVQTASNQTDVVRRWIFILKLVGTANWYQGVDKPSFWQWLCKWRVSWRTAYKVAMILYPTNGGQRSIYEDLK